VIRQFEKGGRVDARPGRVRLPERSIIQYDRVVSSNCFLIGRQYPIKLFWMVVWGDSGGGECAQECYEQIVRIELSKPCLPVPQQLNCLPPKHLRG
jgi:hypothetical protein